MKVLLVALNSKNIHKAPALWCLKAYCEKQNPTAAIALREFSINEPPGRLIGEIFRSGADVVSFSCYIWNIELVNKIAPEVAKLLPGAHIVLGGPEVSFENDFSSFPFAHFIIKGAGEEAFSALLQRIENRIAGEKQLIAAGERGYFSRYPSPYTEDYFQSFSQDMPIGRMLIYYESTRGCPFSCAYCLSSVSEGVQALPLERVFADLRLLVERGAKCIKFVDRTFNANKARAAEIFAFLEGLETGCAFHFEVAADLFDDALLMLIAALPKGRAQFEIGIQSTNEQTLCAVSRKTDIDKAFRNIKRLVAMQNCHVHVDLIAGLPYEVVETFAKAFDACFAVRPHMLQLGFLKLLKGSRLRDESEGLSYLYSNFAPYEVLKSNAMGPDELLFLKEIEEVFDKFYNTGMFPNTIDFAAGRLFASPFSLFGALAEFCRGKNIKLSLKYSYALLLEFLRERTGFETAAHYIKLDCLTFDPKGMLPDAIPQNRRKDIERELRHSRGFRNVRAEYFELDDALRVFVYDEKDRITKAHRVLLVDTNGENKTGDAQDEL
ncbi:MAG: B12-binding domain-containing radical SAM protein [Oscillospiraceae bacterium]|nr:B12-binding domain-containing radical SAM protein [Oscillospiraceae bacterium]